VAALRPNVNSNNGSDIVLAGVTSTGFAQGGGALWLASLKVWSSAVPRSTAGPHHDDHPAALAPAAPISSSRGEGVEITGTSLVQTSW
jgi:hypothetical protein